MKVASQFSLKMGLATFWAIFFQTRLVTLFKTEEKRPKRVRNFNEPFSVFLHWRAALKEVYQLKTKKNKVSLSSPKTLIDNRVTR
jgi:hypothetical protein